jgi:N-acetylglucosaminyl-diphospho-decaprenol L-rhamnosyltransferase
MGGREMTAIDAVIVSYNSRDTLRACVEPLLRIPEVSVTVVDNASSDGSLESVSELPVRAIAAGRNGGFAFGCNLGTAAGTAPFVLFVNPDARVRPADLRRMAEVLEREPDVGLLGPRIVDADGEVVPSMRRFQRVGSTWATALFLHRLFRRAAWANEIVRDPAAYGRPAYPEWLSGACLLARRTVLESVQGFDEGFFLYGEDMDLCARVRAAGYRIRFEPTASVFHEGGRSAPRTGLYAVLARSRIRFARRHSGIVAFVLQHVGLAVGAMTHIAVSARRPDHRRGHIAALRALRAPRT